MLLIVSKNGFKNNYVYLPLSSDKALGSDLNIFSNIYIYLLFSAIALRMPFDCDFCMLKCVLSLDGKV